MTSIIRGVLVSHKVTQKIYKNLHHGTMSSVHAIVVHQTGAETAQQTFNSYARSMIGAHFLIDKSGKIYQTAFIDQKTYHVGKLKSRCLETKSCLPHEMAVSNAIYLKKGVSYPVRVKNLHDHEKVKAYPDRYPTNNDAIGVEMVGKYNPVQQSYESVNLLQNAALKWLVQELSATLNLTNSDIYRHPEISYKQPSEAKTAVW